MTLEERVSRVERQNRRLRQALAVVSLVVVSAMVLGATRQSGVGETVKAQAFHVVDKNGKVRASLSMSENGPELGLLDVNEERRVGLGIDNESRPSLSLHSPGNGSAFLSVNENGPGLMFLGGKGFIMTLLSQGKDSAFLSFRGPKAKNRVRLGSDKDGPSFLLSDTNGKLRASLVVFEGEPALMLTDAKEKDRIGLSLAKDGPVLMLRDANGKPRASLMVVKGDPVLMLTDPHGEKSGALRAFKGRLFFDRE